MVVVYPSGEPSPPTEISAYSLLKSWHAKHAGRATSCTSSNGTWIVTPLVRVIMKSSLMFSLTISSRLMSSFFSNLSLVTSSKEKFSMQNSPIVYFMRWAGIIPRHCIFRIALIWQGVPTTAISCRSLFSRLFTVDRIGV